MDTAFSRTEQLLGFDNINKLKNSHVAVFGVGGVGGYVVESLARVGIGAIDLIDNDTVNITNINRQIIATHNTIGHYKVDAAKQRINEINPETIVTTHKIFLNEENIDTINFSEFDYVVDAIDTVTSKILLITKCKEIGIPIISSMGTGNKLNASMLEVADIYKTSVCPLARVMRYELKKRGVKKLKVVYSKDLPKTQETDGSRHIPASAVFVPAAAGMIIGGVVTKDLISKT